MAHALQSVQEAADRLRGAGYLASPEIASSAFLADRLEKPILVEGPAGVGKTELARALAQATGRTLLRLQCYEGLDESKALYEWEYAKQLLYTQLLKDKIAETIAGGGSPGLKISSSASGSSCRDRCSPPSAPRTRRCCWWTRSTRPTRSSRRSCWRSSRTTPSPCRSWGPCGRSTRPGWC